MVDRKGQESYVKYKTERNKGMTRTNKQKNLNNTANSIMVTREEGVWWRLKRIKGIECVVLEGD